jgi:ABC-type Na+ efflux pump permease subunit
MVAEGNRTMEQIQTELELAKEKYLTFFTSLAIFGYLIIGSLAALIGGIFFSSRNNK